MSQNSNSTNEQPTTGLVTACLSLASIVVNIVMIIAIVNIEGFLPYAGILCTLLPTWATGAWLGKKSGEEMPSDIRWRAILIWIGLNIFIIALLLGERGYSIAMLIHEFGSSSVVALPILAMNILIAYVVTLVGERFGIRSFEKARKAKRKKQAI